MEGRTVNMLWLAVAAVGAPVLAAWAHEIVHAVAVVLLGGAVRDLDLLELHVDFRFDAPSPVRERLVLLAPAIVGVAIVPLALANWDGSVDAWTLVAVLGWVVFALNGGAEGELRLSPPQTTTNNTR